MDRPLQQERAYDDLEDNPSVRLSYNNWYEQCLGCCGGFFGFWRTWCPCVCFCCEYPYQTVNQSEYGLIQRFGKYVQTVKAGLHYVNPCTERIKKFDGRIAIIDLQKQFIISRDNISLNLDATVYYQVFDAKKAHYKIENFSEAISAVVYAILKTICGQHVFQDFLDRRDVIDAEIKSQVGESLTADWGVSIHEIFIKDVRLAGDVESYLSAAARERRKAERKIISAKADVEAAKLMREAADVLDNKAAMQIRYLDTIVNVSKAMANPKVIFMPLENVAETMN